MTALASIDLDVLILLAGRSLDRVSPMPGGIRVCPINHELLMFDGVRVRNALHCAALQYAARLWDQDRDDASMVQFLLEFRAWIDTPGREVMIP